MSCQDRSLWAGRSALLCLCAVAAGSWPGVAAADWEYTRWGMTPQQVVDASAGSAAPIATEESEGKKLVPEGTPPALKSAWRTGDFRFTAYFYFDDSDALTRVILDLEDGDDRGVMGALVERYGEPFRQASTWSRRSGPDLSFTDMAAWQTPTDQIGYLRFRDLGQVQLEWRPRPAPGRAH